MPNFLRNSAEPQHRRRDGEVCHHGCLCWLGTALGCQQWTGNVVRTLQYKPLDFRLHNNFKNLTSKDVSYVKLRSTDYEMCCVTAGFRKSLSLIGYISTFRWWNILSLAEQIRTWNLHDCLLTAVWLRWLDAQHSRLSATPSAHHEREDEWGYDAANLSRHQRDSPGNGYLVAAKQAVHRLCK